jgi:hypothetical protein
VAEKNTKIKVKLIINSNNKVVTFITSKKISMTPTTTSRIAKHTLKQQHKINHPFKQQHKMNQSIVHDLLKRQNLKTMNLIYFVMETNLEEVVVFISLLFVVPK